MFSLVRSSLLIDSILRFLYFDTPAASSKMTRRSIGFASAKYEIVPCEMIDSESRPNPVSRTKS